MTKPSNGAERVLARLKDFQRRSVDYVFRRFYLDQDATNRFLVADEVGLGKTLVARGVIARAIDFLHEDIGRIDIVYICSNISIASQNINRLNVSGVQEFVRPTRLSLLPMHIAGIRQNSVNYVSLTPGTSFDPKSREGRVEERALIHYLLKGKLNASPAGLRRLLQCRVSDDNWQWWTKKWKPESLDGDVSKAYVKNVASDKDFHQKITDFCSRSKRRVLRHDPERLELVAELRFRIAEMSVEMLEPDLIILDEFQRFKNLLDHNNPDARLAQRLFRYEGVKTLLLSATPYKMLSLDHEQEDDHYPDFLKTLRFLFESDDIVEAVKKEIQEFRQALYRFGSDDGLSARDTRDTLQSRLSRVMCRTERVGMTQAQDAMLSESRKRPTLVPRDLHEAVLADRVSSSVGARDIIEYWKSSPYLINFLRRYEFRRKLEAQCGDASEELLLALKENENRLLRRNEIQTYQEVDPANPRMRELFSLTIDRGLWKILWLPPSMPYNKPEDAYADIEDVTKYLVFSAWNVVPDAIASLCSYEAERRMLSLLPKRINHDQLYDELRPLLRYAKSADGRLTGMSVLVLMYPSPGLASLVDPLKIALDHHDGEPIPVTLLLKKVSETLLPFINKLVKRSPETGPEDRRWYWAASAILDGARYPGLSNWLVDESNGWPAIAAESSGERFIEHLDLLQQAMDERLDPPLGRPPADLIQVISQMAVAGPSVCALRALKRLSPSLEWDSPALLQGAIRISEGFRTLFNLPETIALLRGKKPETYYWKLALRHCLHGNIQSLLDEQSHCLVESLGVVDESEVERTKSIGNAIGSSLSVRTSQLQLDEIVIRPRLRKVEFEGYNTRCRFALRFAELKDESGSTVARADTVRDAFNSPFRPFILASTSIGQEGLDFHTWCHSVIHWNLPSNPVDLEQREGRVHRYKGHAIRKNVAKAYGLEALKTGWDRYGDPWNFMFEQAENDRPIGVNDLVPYWIFEIDGGARIERRVPILAFSKEEFHYQRLKRMLAVYRLVFGQPRQEDLLEHLASRSDSNSLDHARDVWRISLEPPEP